MKKDVLITIPTESEMLAFGAKLAKATMDGTVLFLYGPLGAGKTTLTRGFLRGLGYEGKVKSPTYTLVEPYEIAGREVFHFDFYRLHDPNELMHIGIQEYFARAAICIIEWPEKGFPFLPEPDLTCYIAFAKEEREIRLEAHTETGEGVLHRL